MARDLHQRSRDPRDATRRDAIGIFLFLCNGKVKKKQAHGSQTRRLSYSSPSFRLPYVLTPRCADGCCARHLTLKIPKHALQIDDLSLFALGKKEKKMT
jgi:hypothetical protein